MIGKTLIISLIFICAYLNIGRKACFRKTSILIDTIFGINNATSFLIDDAVNKLNKSLTNADQVINKTVFSIVDFGNKLKGEDNVAVGFYLYTKLNSDVPQALETNNLKSFQESNFNSMNQIKIVIHGYTENFTAPENSSQTVLRGFLCNGGDFNIVLIDYKTSVFNNFVTDYILITSSGVPRKVAQKITEFIDFIKHTFPEITNKNIDLIGFSLGGQISAFTAKAVNGKLNSITALDPVALLYSFYTRENQLSRDDADYIETIHTSPLSGLFLETSGVSDIFVNFGDNQPGCNKWIDIFSSLRCNHAYSVKFFVRTLCENEQFIGYECTKAELAIRICQDNPIKKKLIVGGNPLTRKSGIYNILVK